MKVLAVSISQTKGVVKENVPSATLKVDHGVENDAHAGDWHRQVSLLANESIDKMRAEGLELSSGDFAENITTEGLDVPGMNVGDRLMIGEGAVLELTQIGKECHSGCAIMKTVGKCIMPTEGVFFKVLVPGEVRPGDKIEFA
ncbi:MAG: MOSC domain-containing protein [Deltaproteobacteria bacterium]|nr:MOSC domain-containing protein [Deltaproteobacteria bacterium]